MTQFAVLGLGRQIAVGGGARVPRTAGRPDGPDRDASGTGRWTDMTAVDWPNSASPGLHPFRLDVPAGWTAAEPPGALVAFRGPDVDGFRCNLVVFGQRMPAEITLPEVAARALDAAGAGTAVEPGYQREELSGRPVVVCGATARVAGRQVCQLVLATEAADLSPAGLRSVYVLVGSHLADRAGTDQPVLVGAMSSFSLVP